MVTTVLLFSFILLVDYFGGKQMYELISIHENLMSRWVDLRNCETDKMECCFDDSELCMENQQDFGFMKIGKIYNCKILLFGRPLKGDEQITDDCIFCKLIYPKKKIGVRNFFQIEHNGSIYYISEKDVLKAENQKEFWFTSSRKDLIEVDGIVSARCLR